MDNIQDAISKIMSDPEAISQVQSLGKMLGLSSGSNSEPPPPPVENNNNNIPNEMMSKLTQIMPLFSRLRQEDDTTRLLSALRPFLSEEKRIKLDSAKRILHFMKLIPLLKESGLVDLNLF